MPTYRGTSISVCLKTAPLKSSTTTEPEKKKGQNAAQAVIRAQQALALGKVLREKTISDHPSDHIGFLGQDLSVPFLLRVVSYDALRHTSDQELAPHALAIHVEPTKESFLKGPKTSEFGGRAAQDLMISVFFNGTQCDSRYLTGRSASKPEELSQYFSGCRHALMTERPWVIVPDGQEADGSLRGLKRRKSGLLSAEERWKSISAAIIEESIRYGYDAKGERQPLGDYLQTLASLPMPTVLESCQRPGGQRFGVIDVVVSIGRGKKRDTSSSTYITTPTPMLDCRYGFATHEEAPLYVPKDRPSRPGTEPLPALTDRMDIDEDVPSRDTSNNDEVSALTDTFAALAQISNAVQKHIEPPTTPHPRVATLASRGSAAISMNTPEYMSSPEDGRHSRGGMRVQSISEKGLDHDETTEKTKRKMSGSFAITNNEAAFKKQRTGNPSLLGMTPTTRQSSPLKDQSSITRVKISYGVNAVSRELITPRYLEQSSNGEEDSRVMLALDNSQLFDNREAGARSKASLRRPVKQHKSQKDLDSTLASASNSGQDWPELQPISIETNVRSNAPWKIPATQNRRHTNNSFGALLSIQSSGFLQQSVNAPGLSNDRSAIDMDPMTDQLPQESSAVTLPSTPASNTTSAGSLARFELLKTASSSTGPTPAISIRLRRQKTDGDAAPKPKPEPNPKPKFEPKPESKPKPKPKRKQSIGNVTPKSSSRNRRPSVHNYTVEVAPNFEVPELSLDSMITYAQPTVRDDAAIGPLGIVRQIRSERPGDFQESGVLCAFRYVISGEEI